MTEKNQQYADWKKAIKVLEQIEISLSLHGSLADGLKQTADFLTSFPHSDLNARLGELQHNLELMGDFMLKGFQDKHRGDLYRSLVRGLLKLLRDIKIDFRLTHDSTLASTAQRIGRTNLDLETIREKLEGYVTECTMLSLEYEHIKEEKSRQLNLKHHTYLQQLFEALVFSHQWGHYYAQNIATLLISPTIDAEDASMLISAISLAAIEQHDPAKVFALTEIYLHATNVHLRQRALVGWAWSSMSRFKDVYPILHKRYEELLSDDMVRNELLDLQIQMVYCRNTKKDNEKLQQDIMPTLMNNNHLNIGGLDLNKLDEQSLNDILNPDAEEKRMEEMEESMRRMKEMRDQGMDIFFGGFSQMKRFSFFYTLCNWFAPFNLEHPQLQHLPLEFLSSGLVRGIIASGAFCDSDLYSFLLGTGSVFHSLPANLMEALNTGDTQLKVMGDSTLDTSSPQYVRRMYLQDLYRFYTLSDFAKQFTNPFGDSHFLFLRRYPFNTLTISDCKRVLKFLVKRRMMTVAYALLSAVTQTDNYEDMLLKASICVSINKPDEVRRLYAAILEQQPENDRDLFSLGQVAFEVEDYRTAVACFMKLNETHPENQSIAKKLAISLISAKETNRGMQVLFKLHYSNPEDVFVLRSLAWGHLMLGEWLKAKMIYEEFVSKNVATSTDLRRLGYAHWLTNEMPDAVKYLYQAVTKDKDVPTKDISAIKKAILSDAELLDNSTVSAEDRDMVAFLVYQYGTMAQ